MAGKKTVIVTGASQGIGAAVVQAFLDRGYNVVATSRDMSKAGLAPSPNLALVDGDIGEEATAEKIAQTAIARFGSIDDVVNNAGIFSAKPFTDYTADEFRRFVSTNLDGFIFITQIAVRQMLSQGTGGSVTTITAALADNPVAGHPGVDSDDDQGRAQCDYYQPGERIREGSYPLQRGRAWNCRYPVAQGQFEGLDEGPISNGNDRRGERHRRSGGLSY